MLRKIFDLDHGISGHFQSHEGFFCYNRVEARLRIHYLGLDPGEKICKKFRGTQQILITHFQSLGVNNTILRGIPITL